MTMARQCFSDITGWLNICIAHIDPQKLNPDKLLSLEWGGGCDGPPLVKSCWLLVAAGRGRVGVVQGRTSVGHPYFSGWPLLEGHMGSTNQTPWLLVW